MKPSASKASTTNCGHAVAPERGSGTRLPAPVLGPPWVQIDGDAVGVGAAPLGARDRAPGEAAPGLAQQRRQLDRRRPVPALAGPPPGPAPAPPCGAPAGARRRTAPTPARPVGRWRHRRLRTGARPAPGPDRHPPWSPARWARPGKARRTCLPDRAAPAAARKSWRRHRRSPGAARRAAARASRAPVVRGPPRTGGPDTATARAWPAQPWLRRPPPGRI